MWVQYIFLKCHQRMFINLVLFVFVSIAAPIISTSLEKMLEYPRTQAAILHCDAEGDPEPTFDWTKNGVRMGSTERLIFKSGNRFLVIHPLEQTDTGRYECTATNIVANATTSTNLKVFGKLFIYLPKIHIIY